MNTTQVLYGLTVCSDFELYQDRQIPTDEEPPDVVVSRGTRAPQRDEVPSGSVLLDFEQGGEHWYTVTRRALGDYVFRLYGECEFYISADLRDVTVNPFDGGTPGMEAVMTTGGLLALQLYLRGHCVLHGSAVDIGGSAIGFVGHSGMGKSTMAALMCADGAALITDDVLRVDLHDRVAQVRLGATEIRLRKAAESLAARFDDRAPRRRTSVDERQVLRLDAEARDRLPLSAIVLPAPTRTESVASVRRLTQKQALMALLGFPRLMGWQDPVVNGRVFGQIAQLVECVPVLVATVPWGPPFQPEIASVIREAVAETQMPAEAVASLT